MASGDLPKLFDGEIPDPPRGPAEEVARVAWKMGWKAEQLAGSAATHSLTLFEALGELAAEMTVRFDRLEASFEEFKSGLSPKIADAERNAKEAKTSSHDLSEEVEKMEGLLADIKHKSIDSVRIKQLVVEEHQMLVTKQELERLKQREKDADDLEKEKRGYRLSTKSLIVSGVIVTLVGIFATYFLTRATAPQTPATVVAPPH